MATYSSIFIPANRIPTKVSALATGASSAEIVFSNDALIGVVATGNCQIIFGNTGMAAADATGWFIPSGAVHNFDLGHSYDRVRIFNPTAGNIDVYVIRLSRA